MNDDAFLLVSTFFDVAFFFSLIIAVFVFRSLWRTKRAEKLRQRASISSLPHAAERDADGKAP